MSKKSNNALSELNNIARKLVPTMKKRQALFYRHNTVSMMLSGNLGKGAASMRPAFEEHHPELLPMVDNYLKALDELNSALRKDETKNREKEGDQLLAFLQSLDSTAAPRENAKGIACTFETVRGHRKRVNVTGVQYLHLDKDDAFRNACLGVCSDDGRCHDTANVYLNDAGRVVFDDRGDLY